MTELVTLMVLPLVSMLATAIVLTCVGHGDQGQLIATLGPAVWLLGLFYYVVFFHSRRRWPEATWVDRFWKIITLKR